MVFFFGDSEVGVGVLVVSSVVIFGGIVVGMFM